MEWTSVTEYQHPSGWTSPHPDQQAREYCRLLEAGQILFFPRPPFELPDEATDFLLDQRQTASQRTKNLSYRPEEDLLRGYDTKDHAEIEQLQNIMRRYSEQVVRFVRGFLTPYASQLALDFASFRSIEEDGRKLSLHKRNDLLHVDAFPSRPTHGGRILRVFTNINPRVSRVWNTTGPFDALARQYARSAQLDRIAAQTTASAGQAKRSLLGMAQRLGLPAVSRSAYDECMLRFHDYLKENSEFQEKCPKTHLEFPPHATWLVYTDGVAHSVLSGQYAMEQTFIIPVSALVAPEQSPLRILEQELQQKLTA